MSGHAPVPEEKLNLHEAPQKLVVPWTGYVAFVLAIICFSGLLASRKGLITALDFNTIAGIFGTMKDPAKATYMGQGGLGARDGFLFAFSLVPVVMFALGVVEVIDHFGGFESSSKIALPCSSSADGHSRNYGPGHGYKFPEHRCGGRHDANAEGKPS